MTILSTAEIAAARADLLALNEAVANATLTTITGPGAPDGNGDPGPGPVLWSGAAKGVMARERHDAIAGGEQVPVRSDTFRLPGEVAPVLEAAGPDWAATRVTIRDDRAATPVTTIYAVTAMERVKHGITDSVLLTLDEVIA